ncbi:TVP38/TMEM64 family protein [Methylobacterium radiodurans]|uniref:SNARE associated Golgi family protein n=1 Tax=Methylobacterium radiodurans TaxID=2202828 RepID=A0A2U8VTC1_9HYPH|nr:VTT domain-containing protein [Methylobacterium radiodurans]AWN36955.1 SNARE associated Golgi family protein [Methylobacterium radiodurans]
MGPEAGPGRARRSLRWLPLALLVGVSLAALLTGAARLVSLDALLASRAWLHAFVGADYVRALVAAYLVYVGAVVISVPATLMLTMVCGFLFGIVTGALVSVAAATTGAAIVFSIGRGPGADLLDRVAGPRLGALAEGFRRDAFGYIAFLRLLPLFPFWMTNLGPAAFGVPLRTFVAATFLGLLPGAFVYAATGAGIDEVVAAHEAAQAVCQAASDLGCDEALTLRALVTPKMVLGLGALAGFALLSVLLRRLLARRQLAAEAERSRKVQPGDTTEG